MEDCGIQREDDKLLNLRHFCRASPIGFVLPDALSESQELKIVRLYVERISLSEVISTNPVCWTSKAKAGAGIHGHLNSRNICLDSDD
jgi:hypothetical protein